MDEQYNEVTRPVNPRRRKRTKMEIFKEAYLPVIIVAVALVLIIVFIVGAIVRGTQKNRAEKEASIAASASIAEEKARLEQEALQLIADAKNFADSYDYQGAIALLNTFSGDIIEYPAINDKILEYEAAQRDLVAWDDPSKVVNLSFQLLVADSGRGFSNETYGHLIKRNFVTTTEFSKILQQLYENGYILVDFDDFISRENGVYKAKTLYLPKGKKPLMLTQTNVNYNYYLIDSDGDKFADANGCGIASKLLWNGSNFTCEMVDASGNIVTGDFDLVPILEKFVSDHPGFSYQGAKAVLALTGYNGLFGYRTHPSAADYFGETEYQKAVSEVSTVINALRSNGYTLACYTYENVAYGDINLAEMKNDLNSWTNEVTPLLGNVDILAYAQLTDIADKGTYSGEKFTALQDLGFRYYLGFCEDGQSWAVVSDSYVRQGRIMVTGGNLAGHPEWFADLFDPSAVLDSTR